MSGDLKEGLHERLITADVARLLANSPDRRVDQRPLRKVEASRLLGRHLGDYLSRALASIRDKERPDAQLIVANALIAAVEAVAPQFHDPLDELSAQVLMGLHAAGRASPVRPDLPLTESGLYVNANRERRVGVALEREMASADRVDFICAFLFWTGYRELRAALARLLEQGRPVRVLTTTYRGVTQSRVLDELIERGAEVRVSYNTQATRLHAKAWLFHRDSGFSTAFVGSSNLSKAALTAGLEWNVRLSEVENAGVMDEFRGAFESYWSDPEFEPYDPERFALEIKAERPSGELLSVFDLSPRPFQREILDKLAAERSLHGRHRNLVVAATGTGKTVMAALDYRGLATQLKGRPRLLFVAHRKEILRQSQDTFRHAMSDGNFGDLLVDGQRPATWDHVFASIQSLSRGRLQHLEPDFFHTIIVDEFHHAAADTYAALLRHFKPVELLGLTATPERADGRSVLEWFDGRIAAEVRLWDAIDRGLLVPFQYFAVHDNVPLDNIAWRNGRYDVAQLNKLYTGHTARANLVRKAIQEHIDDPHRMRALGFCAGVDHAADMADSFNRIGLNAACITAKTDKRARAKAIADLRNGGLQCIFAVDIFNEGVDIPEVDTVFFLRPTESATVFIQQLGRGLRRCEGKRCLTVLDMVGRAHKRFRYDVRYRALLGKVGRGALKRQVEDGFPYLPSGCSITLDRHSREAVLENLSHSIATNRRSLVRELRDMGPVSLADFLDQTQLTPEDLYRGGRFFADLQRAAGHDVPPPGPLEDRLARGLARIIHADDRLRLDAWKRIAAGERRVDRLNLMLSTTLLGIEDGVAPRALADAMAAHPAIAGELRALLAVLDDALDHQTLPFRHSKTIPIVAHGRYRLAELMAAFGDVRKQRLYLPREGVYYHEASRSNLLFVTLQKDSSDYSPTTMYRDYALGPARFHWQSQSGTRPTDKKGKRHVDHSAVGITPLLFVRDHKKDDRGESVPYTFLGPANLASWSGERPMNIEWELEHEMPAWVHRVASVAR